MNSPLRSISNSRTPVTTILFKDGQIELHLTAQARKSADAEKLLDELGGQLDEVLGEYIFSRRDETLEEVVGDLLRARGYTISTAESCTRRVGRREDNRSCGSSDYFLEA
ncbi:MAG: hypothetical protein IPG76_01760 [Acidobacteria bacterium]|nr:hypothetical protein [Acidobacteriota bacterium]